MLDPSPAYQGYTAFDYLEAGTDYRSFELAPQIGRTPPYTGLELTEAQEQRTRDLLAGEVVISLHDHVQAYPSDMAEVRQVIREGRMATAYEGLARSGITAVFDNGLNGACCISSNAGWKWADIVHDVGIRRADIAHQDFVTVGETLADIRRAHDEGKVAHVFALEAATAIENELDRLDILYGMGVRQSGIAYSEANTLGSGLKERGDGGLTYFGEKAVARMNKLGIAIDISHSGDRTSMDVITASTKPIFITHAGARSVWPTNRMKPDDVIRACAERGGVIGIEAAPHTTLSAAHPLHNLDSFMDHVEYCVDLVGVEHVAFGPDTLFGDHVGLHRAFAGNLSIAQAHGHVEYEEVEYVDGLENPAEEFFNIIGWLVKHGWSDSDIRAVLSGNITRVLEEVWF